MSAVALDRVTTYSDTAFISCTVLPIRQVALNSEEMSGIDGMWDWGSFGSSVVKGAVIGAVTTGIAGFVGGALATGGPGALVTGSIGYIGGFVGGAVGGAIVYAWDEFD